MWGDCPTGTKGPREYHDREEWEFHIRRMHLLHIQYACSIQGKPTLSSLIRTGCGELFATNDALMDHYTAVHRNVKTTMSTPTSAGKKRKADEVITPIIEAMPADVASKNRPVYDGVSRSLSISQARPRARSQKRGM